MEWITLTKRNWIILRERRRPVRLEQELKVSTDYLEIEKTRFGDRLHYTIDIPDTLRQVQVPPFSLQTLVENSVKYGGSDFRVSAAQWKRTFAASRLGLWRRLSG